MSDIKLLDIGALSLLWLIPVLLLLYAHAGHMRRKALTSFIEAGLLPRLTITASVFRRRWKAVLVVLAFAMILLALTRPAWNPKKQKVERRGRDVVFMLDVSRSMLAEDLSPSRLWHAKQAIRDCIDRMEGDRIALVLFAGTTVVKCPLTFDRGFFRMMLDEASPESVSRGGTQIGDALRQVLKDVFDEQAGKYRDVILITDGEDHETYPEEAAKQAGERGVRLIALGLGDENEGRRIPLTDPATGLKTFLTYNGQEVWSKLDANTLRKMVDATSGGKYLNVATGAIDFGDVYKQLVNAAAKQELGAQDIMTYEEKFQVFLALAFLLLAVEMAIPGRKRRE